MAHAKQHDYHIIDPSPWPVLAALGGFLLLGGVVLALHVGTLWGIGVGSLIIVYCMYVWWRDVVREGNAGIDHTPVVQIGLRMGMLLFILSEIMFFVAWFWAFYSSALFPISGVWPAAGVKTFDPWHLPLINTLVLLTSGATVTWAHHALLEGNRRGLIQGLIVTCLLGALFTGFQAYEYAHAGFAYAGNIYGATFFMATGFHGAHVLIGTLFLLVCLVRAVRGDFTPKAHIGFEMAAWYWHFVDVVWLFLFGSIYIWGR